MPDQNQDLQNQQSRDSEAALRDYIQQSRQAGKTDEQIRQELLDARWDKNKILKFFQKENTFYKNWVKGLAVIVITIIIILMPIYILSAWLGILPHPAEVLVCMLNSEIHCLEPVLIGTYGDPYPDINFTQKIYEYYKRKAYLENNPDFCDNVTGIYNAETGRHSKEKAIQQCKIWYKITPE